MHGSLAFHRGLVFVGTQEKTARVRVFDLDGRPLSPGFSFRDRRLGRSEAAGIAVDDDRNVWVADTPSSRVRRFTVFGREIGGLGPSLEEPLTAIEDGDRAAEVRVPVDVCVRGDSDELLLAVASGGERRHAVQLFAGDGRLVRSLQPGGDPHGRFLRVRGIALLDRYVFVAEAGRARIQVFRDTDFHFQFQVPMRSSLASEPTAVAPLPDGRVVVACSGTESALLLCDATGALEKVLAPHGEEAGCVFEPSDLAVEPDEASPRTRLAVIDRDGERVQVFTLDGRCYGAFEGRAV